MRVSLFSLLFVKHCATMKNTFRQKFQNLQDRIWVFFSHFKYRKTCLNYSNYQWICKWSIFAPKNEAIKEIKSKLRCTRQLTVLETSDTIQNPNNSTIHFSCIAFCLTGFNTKVGTSILLLNSDQTLN